MPIESFRTSNEAEWHALRARDVTASQIAALWIDGHEYTDKWELFHTKRGSIVPRQIDPRLARRGLTFERAAVDWLREDYPSWRVHYEPGVYTYFRDPVARIGGTPDVVVDHPERGRGVVQIKTVGREKFRSKWLDEDGAISPPLWIKMQAEAERYLVGGVWAGVAALVVDDRFNVDLPLYDVPETPGLIETMKKRAAEFWADVAADREPDPEFWRGGGRIEAVYPTADPDNELDLTADERAQALLRTRAIYVRDRREADAEIEAIDAEIKHRMGTATVAHLGEGRRIIWRNERRQGRTSPPTNSRVLRLPPEKET